MCFLLYPHISPAHPVRITTVLHTYSTRYRGYPIGAAPVPIVSAVILQYVVPITTVLPQITVVLPREYPL